MADIVKETLEKVKPDLVTARKELDDLEKLIKVQRKMGIDVTTLTKEYTELKDSITRMEDVLKEYGLKI